MTTTTTNANTQTLWVLGHQVRHLPTTGDYALIEVTSDPDVPGPPPHTHEDASEVFYVVEGVLDVMADGKWISLSAGDSYDVPSGVVHTFINRGEVPCRFVSGWSPRGFEQFFHEFGIDANRDDARESSVSQDLVVKVMERSRDYKMTMHV